jgi:formylglycine-generating enzyme required for sulfatase activity/subtilisin family serine protease
MTNIHFAHYLNNSRESAMRYINKLQLLFFIAVLIISGCSSMRSTATDVPFPLNKADDNNTSLENYYQSDTISYRHSTSVFDLKCAPSEMEASFWVDGISENSFEIIKSNSMIRIKNHGAIAFDVSIVFDSCELDFGIIPSGMASPARLLNIPDGNSSVQAHIEYSDSAHIQNERITIHASQFRGNVTSGISTKAILSDAVMVGCDSGIETLYNALNEHNLLLAGMIAPLGLYDARIIDNRNPYDVVQELNSDARLHDAEVESLVFPAYFPHDPFYDPATPEGYRWAFERIRAVDAWDIYSDGYINQIGNASVEGIVFAIPDTGLNSHYDLGLNGFDNWVINTYGKNFVSPGSPVTDNDGHGTAVAGVLGAMGNNGIGMAGMAWNPIFLPCKVFEDTDEYGHVGPVFALLQSLIYIRDLANMVPSFKFVVNMSLGGYEETASYWTTEAINRIDMCPNTILIAGCGNDKNDKEFAGLPLDISADNYYPAALEKVISVGASSERTVDHKDCEVIDEEMELWGTNWGDTVDLCAPGTRTIYTTGADSPDDIEFYFGGTSASCAFTSGLAALIWAKEPGLLKSEVKNKIVESCVPMYLPPEKIDKLGGGRIDALRAFKGIKPDAVINDISWTRVGNPIFGDALHFSGDGIFAGAEYTPEESDNLNFRWYADWDFSYPIAIGREVIVYTLAQGFHTIHLKVWNKGKEWNFWDWRQFSDPATWDETIEIEDSGLPDDCFVSIYIPSGNFTMGCGLDDPNYSNAGTNDEKPQHTHYVEAFWIRKYEVTNIEFNAFMEAGGYDNEDFWSAEGWIIKNQYGWEHPLNWLTGIDKGGNPIDFVQTAANPVNGVSWWEADAFCNWAGLKLPIEAQWEKAARGDGEPFNYPWGFDWIANNCNCNSDSIVTSATAPVGTYSPNGDSPYGLADCAGNVWEWCYEWYEFSIYTQYETGDYTLPTESETKCCRGGGWFHAGDWVTRCSSRYSSALPSTTRYGYIGFRPIGGAD